MQESAAGLTCSVEVLSLNKGVYVVAVKSASPRRVGDEGEMVLPAVHVGPGPGASPDQIEIMTGLRTEGAWLYERGDVLIVKVKSGPATMLLSSLRSEGMTPLELAIQRVDGKQAVNAPAPQPLQLTAPVRSAPQPPPRNEPRTDQKGRQVLRSQVMVHLQDRGDLNFIDAIWAGAPGENLSIQAFSVLPLEVVPPSQIEYKGLTATGVETPWIPGGEICGTRGMDLPLVGFAVRFKPEVASQFDCEYRGAFRSGKIVGPMANGEPCRSSAGDVLEGIQLTFVERARGADMAASMTFGAPEAQKNVPAPTRATGPKFSVFREEVG